MSNLCQINTLFWSNRKLPTPFTTLTCKGNTYNYIIKTFCDSLWHSPLVRKYLYNQLYYTSLQPTFFFNFTTCIIYNRHFKTYIEQNQKLFHIKVYYSLLLPSFISSHFVTPWISVDYCIYGIIFIIIQFLF